MDPRLEAMNRRMDQVNTDPKPKVANRGNRDPSWRYWVQTPEGLVWVPSNTEILSDCGLIQQVDNINKKVLRTKTLVSSVVHLAMETIAKTSWTIMETDHPWDLYVDKVKNAEPGIYEGIEFDKSRAERYVACGEVWWQRFRIENSPRVISVEGRGQYADKVGTTHDLWCWLPHRQSFGVIDWKTTNVPKIPDYYGYQLAGCVVVGIAEPSIPVPLETDPLSVERRIVLLRDDGRPAETRTDFPPGDFNVFNSAVLIWHEREKYNKKNRLLRKV